MRCIVDEAFKDRHATDLYISDSHKVEAEATTDQIDAVTVPITVIFSRCAEPGQTAPRELTQHGIPFIVYQKAPCSNNTRVSASLALLHYYRGSFRMMHHNSGDECSAYLQYIYDEYEALPPAVAFLQYASEQQLMLPSVILTIRAALSSVHRLGFVALGRHTFEGYWPAPCEAAGKQVTFARCSDDFWRRDLGVAPPRFFRFYANGLFAVSRERIRRRPRAWYARVLARLSGRVATRCDGPDTRRRPGAAQKLVGDCHVLEKAWHVLFGEAPDLPPAHVYDTLRAPNVTLRPGGRFYETAAQGRCAVGVPPGEDEKVLAAVSSRE